MSAKVRGAAAQRKKRRFLSGNQNFPSGNQISPVMQKVRGSLKQVKAAQELVFLTGQPLSICQKVLSGHRIENREMLAALFHSKLITSAIIGLTEGVSDPDAKAIRKFAQKLELKRQLAALDQEDGE
jgi:hypothetical protein